MKQADRREESYGDTMHGIALAYQYGDSRLLKLSSMALSIVSIPIIFVNFLANIWSELTLGSLPLDCKLYKGH